MLGRLEDQPTPWAPSLVIPAMYAGIVYWSNSASCADIPFKIFYGISYYPFEENIEVLAIKDIPVSVQH